MGETLGAKLAVFGEARDMSSDESMTAVGTPFWMAPEVFCGDMYTETCDVYSFGVVLLEMLGGKRVFEGETASETLAAVMMKDPSW